MKSLRNKNRHSPRAPRRVVVALRMAGIAGQDKLNGIFDHLSSGHRWQLIIYRTRQEFTAETVSHEISLGTNGFIVGIPDAVDALAKLATVDIPTVVMNVSGGGIHHRRKNIAYVKSNSDIIGAEAAHTLMKQGVYKSYAFVGHRTDSDWSHNRGKAFRNALKKEGFDCEMFDIEHFGDKVDDKNTLADWLTRLPKPCGLLAACDDRSFEILDVCTESKIKVPAEIGIIGVNNDPILCENSEPRLSSIQPDFIGEGRLSAELLESMMAGCDIQDKNRHNKVGLRAIIHRESTVPYSKTGRLVQRILAYLNAEALNGININDVVNKFKVSRSLLELRFRELQHESVYEAILRIRFDEVKRRLRHSNDTIAEITTACGWKNPIPVKALFKKRFGISMREYRKKNRE